MTRRQDSQTDWALVTEWLCFGIKTLRVNSINDLRNALLKAVTWSHFTWWCEDTKYFLILHVLIAIVAEVILMKWQTSLRKIEFCYSHRTLKFSSSLKSPCLAFSIRPESYRVIDQYTDILLSLLLCGFYTDRFIENFNNSQLEWDYFFLFCKITNKSTITINL